MKFTAAISAAVILGVCSGCGGGNNKVRYARPYPELSQGEVHDIHVFRRGTKLELTNTTPRAFGPSTLWLNARFSRPISHFNPGEKLKFKLKDFRDEYSDGFRAGGFFADEPAARLVLAQIETPAADGTTELVGLIVVGSPELGTP